MSETPVIAEGTPPPRRRWLPIALVASLALNVLMIGAVARSLWVFRTSSAIAPASIETSLPGFIASLPPDRRDDLRRAGVPDRPAELRPLRQEIRRARVDVVRQFLADPFDKAAFVAAQRRLADAEARLRQTNQHLLPEIGERMTAAERRAFVNWRIRGHHGRRGDRRGPGGDDDGPRR